MRRVAYLTVLAALGAVAVSCTSEPRTGEAFLVLRSDEVVPLADMEIRFYPKEFATEYDELQVSHLHAIGQVRRDAVSADSALSRLHDAYQSEASRLEARRDSLQGERSRAMATLDSAAASTIDQLLVSKKARLTELQESARDLTESTGRERDTRAAALQNELTTSEAQVQSQKRTINEWTRISAPYDSLVEQKEIWESRLKREQEALERRAVELTNEHILEHKLQVPLLEYESCRKSWAMYSGIWCKSSSISSGQLVVGTYGGGFLSESIYMCCFPEEVKDSYLRKRILGIFEEWLSMKKAHEARMEQNGGSVYDTKRARDKALVPWQNVHGSYDEQQHKLQRLAEKASKLRRDLDYLRSDAFVAEALKKVTEDIRLLSGEIADIEANPERARARYQEHAGAELVSEIGEVQEEIRDLRRRWEQFLERALEEQVRVQTREDAWEVSELLRDGVCGSVHTRQNGSFLIPSDARFLYARHERANGECQTWLMAIETEIDPVVRLSNSSVSSLSTDLETWVFNHDFE